MPTEFKRIFFVQAKMFFMIPDYKGLKSYNTLT